MDWISRIKADLNASSEKVAALRLAEPAGKSSLLSWHQDSHPMTKNSDGSPRVFYHGSHQDFNQFQDRSSNASHRDISVSPDAAHANWYAREALSPRQPPHPGSVYPVHVHAKNVWDFEDPSHVDAVVQHLQDSGMFNSPKLPKTLRNIVGDATDPAAALKNHISLGDWRLIELNAIRDRIRNLGFDGYTVTDNPYAFRPDSKQRDPRSLLHQDVSQLKNLNVFSANQIKSAIANSGSYNPLNPRLDMAENDLRMARDAWHKDSHPATKNDDGTPYTYYHGTGVAFDKFKPSRRGTYGAGIYLTPSPEVASDWAEEHQTPSVLPLHVHMRRPYIYDAQDGDVEASVGLAHALGGPDAAKKILRAMHEDDYAGHGQYFQKQLMALGHDGLIVNHGPDPRNQEIIAFNPRQVKSAIHNKGGYDSTDPRINMAEPLNTAARDAWHADSHPITKNADGSPKTFYHGTRQGGFDQFEIPKKSTRYAFDAYTVDSQGAHFSPEPNVAAGYAAPPHKTQGAIYPVHLKMTRPLSLMDRDQQDWTESDHAAITNSTPGTPGHEVKTYLDNHYWSEPWEHLDDPDFVDNLKALGYDGAHFQEWDDNTHDPSGAAHTFVVFHPNQIKSAIHNIGGYNAIDPRINMAEGLDIAARDSWHADSHPFTKNEDGTPKVFYHGTRHNQQRRDSQGRRRISRRSDPEFNAFEPQYDYGVSVTSHPDSAGIWAHKYALPDENGVEQFADGARIYPLHIHARKPFDYQNEEHLQAIRPAFYADASSAMAKLPNESPESKQARLDEIVKNMTESTRGGYFGFMERPSVIAHMKKLGFDAMRMREMGYDNLNVFSPTQIKSATHNTGGYNPQDPRINMAEDDEISLNLPTREPFYSHLQQVLASKVPNRAPAQQILQTLLAHGVKPDELQSTGLDELLSSNLGAIHHKSDLLNHARKNEIEVTPRWRSGDETPYGFVDEPELDDVAPFEERTQMVEMNMGDYLRQAAADRHRREREEYADAYGDDVEPEDPRTIERYYREAVNDAAMDPDTFRPQIEKIMQDAEENHAPVKYQDYATPGGENYREMLLQLHNNPGGYYQSSHWDEPNVVAHARMDDREAHTYTPDQIQDIDQRISKALGYPSNSLASGSSQAAVAKGAITPLEAAQWSHAKGYAYNDQRGATGSGLHVHEIQSDWHQAGREFGYLDKDHVKRSEELRRAEDALHAASRNTPEFQAVLKAQQDGTIENNFPEYMRLKRLAEIAEKSLPERQTLQNLRARHEEIGANTSHAAMPDAPFKKSWPELVFKHLLQHAVDNGHDRITWDTGDTNAKRYGLENHIDDLTHGDNGDGTFDVHASKNGDIVFYNDHMSPQDLHEHFGRDLAHSIINREGQLADADDPNNHYKAFWGKDLSLKNTGMHGFYDDILPKTVNKMTKKWGGKVYPSTIHDGYKDVPVHALDITPQMRNDIQMKGQAKFSEGRDALLHDRNAFRLGSSPAEYVAKMDPEAHKQIQKNLQSVRSEPISTRIGSKSGKPTYFRLSRPENAKPSPELLHASEERHAFDSIARRIDQEQLDKHKASIDPFLDSFAREKGARVVKRAPSDQSSSRYWLISDGNHHLSVRFSDHLQPAHGGSGLSWDRGASAPLDRSKDAEPGKKVQFRSVSREGATVPQLDFYGNELHPGTLHKAWDAVVSGKINPEEPVIKLSDFGSGGREVGYHGTRYDIQMTGQAKFSESDDLDYDAFQDDRDSAEYKVLREFLDNPDSVQSWSVLPAARVKKIWNDYARDGFVRDVKGMDSIAEHVIGNIHRLGANTNIAGHSDFGQSPHAIAEYHGLEWPEGHDDKFADHIVDHNGQWRISDYAMKPLFQDALKLRNAKTPEEQLQHVDRVFNRVHPRSDMAANFIEGGTGTLNHLAGRPSDNDDERKAQFSESDGWEIGYHGTSSKHVPSILAEGLRSTHDTGVKLFADTKDADLRAKTRGVYLTHSPERAASISQAAARKFGGDHAIIVSRVHPAEAEHDEDWPVYITNNLPAKETPGAIRAALHGRNWTQDLADYASKISDQKLMSMRDARRPIENIAPGVENIGPAYDQAYSAMSKLVSPQDTWKHFNSASFPGGRPHDILAAVTYPRVKGERYEAHKARASAIVQHLNRLKTEHPETVFEDLRKIPGVSVLEGGAIPFRGAENSTSLEKWHSDSDPLTKNADGSPKTFYHGTASMPFTVFTPQAYSSKPTIWAAGDPELAAARADIKADEDGTRPHIYPIHIHAKKVFDYRNPAHVAQLQKAFEKYGRNIEDLNSNAGNFHILGDPKIAGAIQRLGYDAYLENESPVYKEPSIAVWDSKQIKSALHNVGGYSSSDPRIHMHEGRALRFDYRFAGHHVGFFPLTVKTEVMEALRASGRLKALLAKAHSAPIQIVPHGNIVGTQHLVVGHNVEKLRGWSVNPGDRTPIGIKTGNEVHVLDGHHRIAADYLDGFNASPMRVVESN